MDAVVDRYFPVLDALETELEAIEEAIFDRGGRARTSSGCKALKRRDRDAHAVAPLVEVAGKLHGGRVPAVCANTQEYFRDVHDHLARINAAIDAMRETIATAIQVNLSMVTIEESETTKRLAAWAAIFAVSTALAGVWGMNFDSMPELHWRWGYPMALGLIAAAAGLLVPPLPPRRLAVMEPLVGRVRRPVRRVRALGPRAVAHVTDDRPDPRRTAAARAAGGAAPRDG